MSTFMPNVSAISAAAPATREILYVMAAHRITRITVLPRLQALTFARASDIIYAHVLQRAEGLSDPEATGVGGGNGGRDPMGWRLLFHAVGASHARAPNGGRIVPANRASRPGEELFQLS